MRQTCPWRLDDRDTITSLNLLPLSVQPRCLLTIERVGEHAAHERLLSSATPRAIFRRLVVGEARKPEEAGGCRGNGYGARQTTTPI